MENQFTSEKSTVIQRLYNESVEFRATVDSAVRSEAEKAKSRSDELSSFAGAGETSVPAKRRGRPAGSKSKPKTGSGRGPGRPKKSEKAVSNGSETSGKVTHKDAIAQILAKATAEGMTSAEIGEALQKSKLSNYEAPSPQTLLTVLHGMKKEKLINFKGKRPGLKYSLSK